MYQEIISSKIIKKLSQDTRSYKWKVYMTWEKGNPLKPLDQISHPRHEEQTRDWKGFLGQGKEHHNPKFFNLLYASTCIGVWK